MAVPVVVITGKKGSGKDTFGEMVYRAFGELGNFEIIEHLFFAEPLKRLVVDMFGVAPRVVFGNSQAKESHFVYGRSVREVLQILGTEVFREMIHTDFWVHRMLRNIVNASSMTSGFVITDCRFPNEWELLSAALHRDFAEGYDCPPSDCLPKTGRDYECHLVRVKRPGYEDSDDAHASETSIDLLDAHSPLVITNDGTMGDLEKKARDFVQSVLGD